MNEIAEVKQLGKCHHCKTDIYSDQVFEFESVLYCSTQCIVNDLLNEEAIVDLSK